MSTFFIGINTKIIGKNGADQLSHAGAWALAQLNLAGLADHIGKGHPWMPAQLDEGQPRQQRYSNRAAVLALDIDGGMTIAQAMAHPFIAAHCGLGIESASSTPEHHKFRLVFQLGVTVEGHESIRICNRYLAHLVGSADPSCKDASRYFFGAPGRKEFLLNEAATLPASFVEDAIAWHEAAVAKAAAAAEANRRRWAAMPKSQSGDVVRDALGYIRPYTPNERRYGDLIAMIGGVLNECGADGELLLQEWDGGRGEWGHGGFDRILDSVRTSQPTRKATLGTLFYLAKQEGFRYPEKTWLDRIADRLSRKPTPQQSAQALRAALGDTPFTGHEYEPGQRLEVWQRAIKAGYHYILDTSRTGSGKSHDAGMARPDMFGEDVGQVLYLSNSHYSPTTDTLKDWKDLHGRHKGLTRETLPDGSSRLRRAQQGEERVVPANCGRTDLINVLRGKNVDGADSAGVICGTCSLKDACSHSQGNEFGYLNQRKLALSAPLLRLHPDSAPGDDYGWAQAIAIWDEPSESFTVTKSVVVTAADVDQVISRLAVNSSELFNTLRPFLAALRAAFDAKQGKYGIGHHDLMAALPALPEGLDLAQVRDALSPDLSMLDPEVAEGVRVSDLPGRSLNLTGGVRFEAESHVNLRRHFSEGSDEAQRMAEANVLKQWLPDLIEVVTGGGGLHLSYEALTITRPSYRHRAIAAAAKGNILMDATLSLEDAALLLGCTPDEIYLCRQRPQGGNNLRVTQINDLGRLGMQRGADQTRRVAALVSHYRENHQAMAIDFKKYGEDGAWWRDSRGSNAFQGCNTLLLIGTPCPNLAALQATYACLTGSYPQPGDDAFAAWCDRRVRADILQGTGRLRANRRPDEQLHVVVVSNVDLGIPAQQVAAKDITVQAASKLERAEMAIKAAVAHLRAQGAKITERAIAKLAGLSQSRVHQLKALISFAIEGTSSKSNQNSGPPDPDIASIVWGGLNLCSTEAELGATVADLLTGIVDPADFIHLILAPPDGADHAAA